MYECKNCGAQFDYKSKSHRKKIRCPMCNDLNVRYKRGNKVKEINLGEE